MSVFLQTLIGAKEPMFTDGLKRLEKSTGNDGVDVRLIADITERAHEVMRKLALDTSDTSGKELYYALIEAVRSGMAEDVLIDTDYAIIKLDNQLISMNLIDVIENTHHEMHYNHQIFSHGQRSLRGELLSRYIEHRRTNHATTTAIAESMGILEAQ